MIYIYIRYYCIIYKCFNKNLLFNQHKMIYLNFLYNNESYFKIFIDMLILYHILLYMLGHYYLENYSCFFRFIYYYIFYSFIKLPLLLYPCILFSSLFFLYIFYIFHCHCLLMYLYRFLLFCLILKSTIFLIRRLLFRKYFLCGIIIYSNLLYLVIQK